MIHDIAPHRLDNSFKALRAEPGDPVLTFAGGNVLIKSLSDGQDGSGKFPSLAEIAGAVSVPVTADDLVYAFSMDDRPVFLLPQRLLRGKIPKGMEYTNIRGLYRDPDRWMALAAVTGSHLDHWYREHVYCGCCGAVSEFSERERAKVCPQCGNIQYPRISPVIMAAITDGDRLLVTRYAGRPYKGFALIAGFVEIGESVEGALRREVMEEVGLKVKNLKYFGSQPWGFSDSLITGFFAELDGSDEIRLDRNELSEALWIARDEIPPQSSDMSITAEMIDAFREGRA